MTVMTTDDKFREAMKAERDDFTTTVRKELEACVLGSIRQLAIVAIHSKNDQAKTAACRTLLALAKDAGVLNPDPVRSLMGDLVNTADNIEP